MDTESLRKIDPSQFQYTFLSNGIRSDGREFSNYRNPLLTKNIISHCHGSASLRCGKSFIIASVTGEISSDFYQNSFEESSNIEISSNQIDSLNGFLVNSKPIIFIDIKFPKIHGFEIRNSLGQIAHIDAYIKSELSNLLNSKDVIDYSSLKIKGNNFASWVLFLTINYIEYDGNFLDLCLLTALSALENIKLPHVEWDSGSNWWREKEEQYNEQAFKNSHTTLKFINRPMTVTFANVFNQYWLVDPCQEEEEIGICVSFQKIGENIAIKKDGGYEIDIKDIQTKLHSIANTIFEDMNSLLNNLKLQI